MTLRQVVQVFLNAGRLCASISAVHAFRGAYPRCRQFAKLRESRLPSRELTMASTNSPNTNPYVSDRRLRIRDVLSQRDQELGELYWAAIEILDPPTPARRRMSAHAIREMTKALPRVIDVPAKETDQRLGD